MLLAIIVIYHDDNLLVGNQRLYLVDELIDKGGVVVDGV
jgi:hypothetical protein